MINLSKQQTATRWGRLPLILADIRACFYVDAMRVAAAFEVELQALDRSLKKIVMVAC
jgi:hypothetical protein